METWRDSASETSRLWQPVNDPKWTLEGVGSTGSALGTNGRVRSVTLSLKCTLKLAVRLVLNTARLKPFEESSCTAAQLGKFRV